MYRAYVLVAHIVTRAEEETQDPRGSLTIVFHLQQIRLGFPTGYRGRLPATTSFSKNHDRESTGFTACTSSTWFVFSPVPSLLSTGRKRAGIPAKVIRLVIVTNRHQLDASNLFLDVEVARRESVDHCMWKGTE